MRFSIAERVCGTMKRPSILARRPGAEVVPGGEGLAWRRSPTGQLTSGELIGMGARLVTGERGFF